MRKITSIFFFFIVANNLCSQQIIPVNKSENVYITRGIKKDIKHLKKDIKPLKKIKTLNSDTLILIEKKNEQIQAFQKKFSLVDKESIVHIYGFGSSDAVNLSGITSNGGFSFGANIGSYTRVFLSIGIGADLVKSEKQDSVRVNSIFFPDNARSIINGHYERCVWSSRLELEQKQELLAFAEGSFQDRNIEGNDSVVHNFKIFNFSLGLKYRWAYKKENNRFVIDAGLGLNYIEIAKQSKQSFESLISSPLAQDNHVPTIFRGINGLFSIQYNDVNIYARGFFPVSKSINYLTSANDQHELFFSVGAKVMGSFFSF